MRKRSSNQGLTVNAVAGSYVVILGLNITDAKRAGLRGFAIKRTDHTANESYWMSGTKVFRSVEPHPAPGMQYSSLKQPFQTFQWADYSAKPGRDYTYMVVALYGDPGALEQRVSVDVSVTTEPIEGAAHTIHFNRGSAATQEYARRFQNKRPGDVGQAAYDWLSRGLIEGIIAFIQRAQDGHFGLKGAYYEFQWPAVLNELRAAKSRGVDIDVVFDDINNDSGPHTKNETAITAARIKSITTPRSNGTLMHNKFLVLTQNGTPKAVLFGSTNLTENGLFGHANCTHVVENETIAGHYLDFYKKLATDPETARGSGYKTWTVEQTPAPATEFIDGMAPVFSPRANLDALDWYGQLAGSATDALFMTFAFGMNETFRAVYAKDDAVLRFGLMEKEWNGRNKEAQIAAIRALQARENVVIAIGNRIAVNNFDQWLKELDRITGQVNVQWVHLKFMLVDPLSDHPIVVTGSANFSDASTKTNDENMLVIKDNTRVADIYLGEYMRLYSHYAFREAVRIFLDRNPNATADDMKQGFLIENGDWTTPYFDPTDRSARMARRLYFAGAAYVQVAEKIAVSAVTAFRHRYNLLRKPGVAKIFSDELKVEQWIRQQEQHEQNQPLSIKGPGLFMPTEELPIRSEPLVEQDVVALFNQMLSSGLIRGIQLIASSQYNQYDGLFRVRMDPPFDKYVRGPENPLGIEEEIFTRQEAYITKVKVLEYKYNFDGLVEELQAEVKAVNDIGLVVAWEMGQKWREMFDATCLFDEDNSHHRQIHGTTHSFTHSVSGMHAFEAIILKDLINFLTDPDREIARQREAFEEV